MYSNFQLTKNKVLEFNLFYNCSDGKSTSYELRIENQRKCDHAGFYFSIIFRRTMIFEFNIYDIRHWNDDKDCWEVYD